MRLYESLYDALITGDTDRLDVKPEQCVDVLRVIDAAFLSHREGRVVVL